MTTESLLRQFEQEAARSRYITGEYIRQYCKICRQFIYSLRKGRHRWTDLLERDGWRIQRKDTRVQILNPLGECETKGAADLILPPILNHVRAWEKIAELRARRRLEYGIVFSGGGAKGAFEVGVWKWLARQSLAERFTGVSGASVGALNALLFAQGDYRRAEEAWLRFEDGDLTRPNTELLAPLIHIAEPLAPAGLLINLMALLQTDQLAVFRNDKLERIVREYIDNDALQNKLTYVSLSALTLRLGNLGKELFSYPEYTYLDAKGAGSKEENIRKVLGSSAFPLAFTPQTLHQKTYIDGGLLDNHPIYPLIKAGYRKIIVVHLDPESEQDLREERQKLEKRFVAEELRDVTILRILPDWKKAGIWSVFEINPELTQERIESGYKAAERYLGPVFFPARRTRGALSTGR